MKNALNILLVTAILAACGSADAGPITTGTLIEEMVDMRRLAEFPDPYYKTLQFSSYDHRSALPGGPEWFANSDGFGREPMPNFEAVVKEPDEKGVGEYLICDVQALAERLLVHIPEPYMVRSSHHGFLFSFVFHGQQLLTHKALFHRADSKHLFDDSVSLLLQERRHQSWPFPSSCMCSHAIS